MRSKRGITLVSLVVTIIVLMILAGVSINLTLGENGIITIAKKARENMELATIEEEIKLNELYTQIEVDDESENINYDSISKLIEFKQKIASAITDMGIETLETANADTMAINIRSIATNKDASSISYNNRTSELTGTNVQDVVDELDGEVDKLNSSIVQFKMMIPDWSKKETITNNSYSCEYTATENGFIALSVSCTNTSGAILQPRINGVNTGNIRPGATTERLSNTIPIGEGDVFSLTTDSGNSTKTVVADVYFIPCK